MIKRFFENRYKFDISKFAILLCVFVVIYINYSKNLWNKETGVIQWDVVSYYEYLPAFFIYNDMSLQFKDKLEKDPSVIIWGYKLENGNYAVKTSMGLSYLYLPFFLAAHTYASFSTFPPNGYSVPYKYALVFSSLFYLIIALIFLRKILLTKFNQKITGISIVIVVLCTNLLFYTTDEAPMSHTYNFALFSGFIYFTIKWYESINFRNTLIIGFIFGLITLVRPVNALIIIFFVLYGITRFNDFKTRFLLILTSFKFFLLIGISILIGWLPQIIYWKYVTGQYFYYSYGNERFFFDKPQVFNFLLGFRKGWLIYSPVMIFSVAGLFFLKKHLSEYFLPVLIFFIVNIYVLSSWWSWWFGGSFGMRAMIDSYPIMIFPLAAFLNEIGKMKNVVKYIIITALGFTSLLGVYNNIKYNYGSVHWDSMTGSAYFDSFWNVRPSKDFYDLLEEPDYEAARAGVQKVKRKEITDIYKINDTLVFCNLENINNGKIIARNKVFNLQNNDFVSSKESFSGEKSLILNKHNPYGLDFDIKVKTGDKLLVSVYKKGDSQACIVAAGCENSFYKIGNNGIIQENGFKKLILELYIENNDCPQIKIFLWNPGNEDAFFDDYCISLIE